MRTFIAIALPDCLKEELSDLQTPDDEIRWQPPRQMHITLKYLGQISYSKATELKSALEDIDQPGFKLNVEGWGTFPPNGPAKVIWTGISPSKDITKLHDKVESCCTSLGFEKEKHSFTPHITLGRVKGNYKNRQIASLMDDCPSLRCDLFVESFVLYESQLKNEGATHTVIKEFPLRN